MFLPSTTFPNSAAPTTEEIIKFRITHLCLPNKQKLARINPLTPNDPYRGRTAPLTSKLYILYIYSTNTGTEYFKHGICSPFFSSSKFGFFHNSNVFGSCIIHILYTVFAKIKKKNNSGAKRLNSWHICPERVSIWHSKHKINLLYGPFLRTLWSLPTNFMVPSYEPYGPFLRTLWSLPTNFMVPSYELYGPFLRTACVIRTED